MGCRKKLRELRRSYEILNSHESFHITTLVKASKQAKQDKAVCSEDSAGHALTPTAMLQLPFHMSRLLLSYMVTKCDKATTGVPSLGTYHKKKSVSKKVKLTVCLKGLSNSQHALKGGWGSKYSKSGHVN